MENEKELFRILGLLRLAYQDIPWSHETESAQWSMRTAIEHLQGLLEGKP